ncbi:phosphatase PAP2 family protein [Candidatus Woesearchaeota archaeon]|nr:phosphatase PAP2 family protein [Candidatus Woesearchaeota archaeon]
MEKRGIIIYFLFIFLLILCFYLDNPISLAIARLRTDFLNNLFVFITSITNEILIIFFFSLFFIWKDEKREWILPLWISFIIGAVLSLIIKISVQRLRPFQQGLINTLPSLVEQSHSLWNFSFPSSHTLLAFCLLPILIKAYPKLKEFFISLMLFIGFSRIYLGLHFLSDVFAGAIIGYGIGKLVVMKEENTKFGERTYKKIREKIKVIKRKTFGR